MGVLREASPLGVGHRGDLAPLPTGTPCGGEVGYSVFTAQEDVLHLHSLCGGKCTRPWSVPHRDETLQASPIQTLDASTTVLVDPAANKPPVKPAS